jgi:hypothetical protein
VALIAISLLTGISLPVVANAISNDWTSTTRSVSYSDGVLYQGITHSGNSLIAKQTLPYISVVYPTGRLIDDIGTGNCPNPCLFTTDIALAGKTIYTVEFFVNMGMGCEPGNWQNRGCYRYKEIMEFWDAGAAGSGSPARFRPVLQAYGPGLANVTTGFYGNYNPYWRIDTEMPTGTNNEYLIEKTSTCSTTWNDIICEARTTPNCSY